MTRRLAHVLTITPTGNGNWDWTVTCPYTPTEARPCDTWQECACTHDAGAYDRLMDSAEPEPCLAAPDGTHEYNAGLIGYRTGQCWANACWHTRDEITDIHASYGPGVFLVDVTGSDDGEFIELPVLAMITRTDPRKETTST